MLFLGMLSLLSFTLVNAQNIPAVKITEVVQLYSNSSDSTYVINFWATFCKPCIAELPHLQSISTKYKSDKVKLLLVSLDLASFYPKKIASFAKQQGIVADVLWLNETDADYFCTMIDQQWSGAIPATLIVRPAKGYKKFFEAELTAEEFERELKLALK